MRTFLTLVVLGTLAGCAADPDAGLYGRPVSTRDAERQYKARLLQMEDRRTRRSDIEEVMGDPDQVDDANRVIMYHWVVKRRDSEDVVRSFVIAQFDDKGVLTKHQQYDHGNQFGGPKLPETALDQFLNPQK